MTPIYRHIRSTRVLDHELRNVRGDTDLEVIETTGPYPNGTILEVKEWQSDAYNPWKTINYYRVENGSPVWVEETWAKPQLDEHMLGFDDYISELRAAKMHDLATGEDTAQLVTYEFKRVAPEAQRLIIELSIADCQRECEGRWTGYSESYPRDKIHTWARRRDVPEGASVLEQTGDVTIVWHNRSKVLWSDGMWTLNLKAPAWWLAQPNPPETPLRDAERLKAWGARARRAIDMLSKAAYVRDVTPYIGTNDRWALLEVTGENGQISRYWRESFGHEDGTEYCLISENDLESAHGIDWLRERLSQREEANETTARAQVLRDGIFDQEQEEKRKAFFRKRLPEYDGEQGQRAFSAVVNRWRDSEAYRVRDEYLEEHKPSENLPEVLEDPGRICLWFDGWNTDLGRVLYLDSRGRFVALTWVQDRLVGGGWLQARIRGEEYEPSEPISGWLTQVIEP